MPPDPAASQSLAEQLAQRLLSGELDVNSFLGQVSQLAVANVGEAQVDLDRLRRCGFPEVVYGEGKPSEVVAKIFRAILAEGQPALATRIDAAKAGQLSADFPEGSYNPLARTFRIEAGTPSAADAAAEQARGVVAVVTAGTTDLPVAEEARETLLWMGHQVTLVQDVGVAGPQRLPAHLNILRAADAVVVVAGMEGALPSVVGGYVSCPVVGVPTSVGYGANLGGMAALLSMLNSCASNVTVVNIDSGFKGGYVAGLIARNVAAARQASQRSLS